MAIPLLSTKFHIPPPRVGSVTRTRLMDRLNEGIQHKLILISAPAGYGKSMLLSEWVHSRSRAKACLPVAWLSLEKADNDPSRFWVYALTALQTIRENLGATALAALQSPQPPAIETLLTSLIIDIAERSPEPVVLVLDDFHLITAPPIQEALLFLVDHLPSAMHLILSGRADPPWPLARLRVSGEMAELRTDDLRFTAVEVATFLNDTMGLDLSAADISALEDRTEGWIVGLQMAALSMQGRKDTPVFIQAFHGSNRFILDYLIEEVLDRQPPDIQDFLHRTAVLDRMTASLCNTLTDRQDSQTILVQLEQANLFLVSLDDERRWYRYHHLFADLLRSRLQRSQPDQMVILHQQASKWFEEKNLIIEAVAHALAAHDLDRVAHLLEENMLEMLEHGNLGNLVEWFNTLPGDMVRSQPWLSIARAWVLAFTGSFDAITPCLEEVARALPGESQLGSNHNDRELSPDKVAAINGHIKAIRCYVMDMKGEDPQQAIELAQTALAQLTKNDWRARSLVEILLGSGYRRNMDFAKAHETLTRALGINRAAEQKYGVIDILCQIARVESDQGHLRQAAATCREALRLADEHRRPGVSRLPVASSALITLSGTLYEQNDLSSALDHTQDALDLARQWGQVDSLTGGYLYLILIQIAKKEFDKAFESIQGMKQLYGIGPFPRRPVALEALARLAMNDMQGAAQCDVELLPHTSEGWRLSILSPLYIAQFRQGNRPSLDDVLNFLTSSLQRYEAAGSLIGMAQILAWQAMAFQALGKVEEANMVLTRSLSFAEKEGYVRTFLDGGDPMEELLMRFLAARRTRPDEAFLRMSDYGNRLLETLNGKTPALKRSAPPSSTLVEPLSDREMEVLRLLTSTLSIPEIARELNVSANTIRTHVKSIYAKLNAHGRMEALQRAREFGLLPS